MAFPDGIADFRSDTVTRPTDEMRRAMAEAEVGDDVYGEDPTVNRLEEASAAIVGKEASVFVPSGTMGNQLAIMTQTSPGEEVLCDEGAHCRNVERGAASALSGVAFRTVHAPGGRIAPHQVEVALAAAGRFYPRVGLMVWENTHNLSGGQVIPIDDMAETTSLARSQNLSVHLDGARIFNAAVKLGVEVEQLATDANTITFCFSKGLGAPVGSVLCGSKDLIDEARYLRKRLGGGMRQVGVLAAAALVAMRDWERLAEDHELALRIAEGILDRAPHALVLDNVETNIINVAVDHLGPGWPDIAARLEAAGIRSNPPLNGVWRLVTHRDVGAADGGRLLAALFR